MCYGLGRHHLMVAILTPPAQAPDPDPATRVKPWTSEDDSALAHAAAFAALNGGDGKKGKGEAPASGAASSDPPASATPVASGSAAGAMTAEEGAAHARATPPLRQRSGREVAHAFERLRRDPRLSCAT